MQKRQIDIKKTKQVRIDSVWHHLAKMRAAEEKTTIRELVERGLAEVLSPLKGGDKNG